MKISAVIPAYNAAKYLPRCLESVFSQTRKADEVIVVDDGSTDDTAAIASTLGATVITRPNGGISAARNTGIRRATGDWIALLDADDCWHPNKLQIQESRIRPNVVLVYTGVRFVDVDGTRGIRQAIDPIEAKKRLLYENPISCTYLIRRDALLLDGGYREDVRACEDWEMLVRLSKLGDFEAVEAPLTNCYLHPDSLSSDPDRMIHTFDQILETSLLNGFTGLSRWLWKHRIRSVQLYKAGLIARDNALQSEASYMMQSVREWPSPFWAPHRFKLLAVTLLRRPSRSES